MDKQQAVEFLRDATAIESLTAQEEWAVYERRLQDQLYLAIKHLAAAAPDNTAALLQAKGEIGALLKTLELPEEIAARVPGVRQYLKGEEPSTLQRTVNWFRRWIERKKVE